MSAKGSYSDYHYMLKYIVVGDTGVGKSCLLLQYTDKRFEPAHDLTIGVEFGSRMFTDHDATLKLQVWDTAGQESFRSITRSYYNGAAVAILVFDVTRRETFTHMRQWVREIREHCGTSTTLMLVGNKADLTVRRSVRTSEGEALALEVGAFYCETSAKTGKNVAGIFEIPARAVHKRTRENLAKGRGLPVGVRAGVGSCAPGSVGLREPVSQSPRFRCCSTN